MTEGLPGGMEVLVPAIKLEQDGVDFYLKAAETTQDEKGRHAFLQLARDEKNHLELLERQYKSLKDDLKWTRFPEIRKITGEFTSSIFPQDAESFKKVITQQSKELEAVLFGLDIEKKSFELYKQSASRISDTIAKEMFEFLAGEEMEHFNILMMRYEYLTGHPGY